MADSAKGTKASVELTCPECGRTFSRGAALGAHRRHAHGVAGSSKQAAGGSRRRVSSSSASARGRSAARTATTTPFAASSPARQSRTHPRKAANGAVAGVDRDALLKALFPSGIPAREEVLRALSGWLDEAERLARMR